MRLRRPLSAPLLVLAVAASAASSVGVAPDPPIVPAPPPGGFCRIDPPAPGWPSISAPTDPVPDLSPFQDARAGLDMPPALTGAGIDIGDVEYEWASQHLDLAPRGLPAAIATGLPADYLARDHGTAVLGILGAAPDGRGVTGLAPGADLHPVSPFFAPPAYEPVRAITEAAAGLGPGDVLLIELQAQVSPTQLGPIEYEDSVRAAIRQVVDRGVVVVEPAGNGNLDIGTLGKSWLSNPADPLASGALIVGAGGSGLGIPDVGDRHRVPGTNYGARVDVQGYGAAVVTTGYADLPGTGLGAARAYTACFDGTSSASATVAAAVAVLQQAAVASTGSPLTPAAVRSLLVTTGLPQASSPAQRIGPRPQVAGAIAAIPSSPGPPPPVDPGAGTPAPLVPPPANLTPAPLPTGVSAGSPALRRVTARLDRRARRLVVRLHGAAPSVTVRVGARRLTVRGGRVVLGGVRSGRYLFRVDARAAAGRTYRPVRFRITVSPDRPPRVVRL